MSRYADLGGAIVSLISSGVNEFSAIHLNPSVRAITKEICLEDGFRTDEFRYVDRRLQALRKQGKIAFNKNKWELA